MIILLILMALVAITAVAFALRKPPVLTEAERVRIGNQALLRAEKARLDLEKLDPAAPAPGDDLTTITLQVTGRGRRKSAEGFEILGKGWVGKNSKNGQPFCYFPVLYRDGAPVATDDVGLVLWAKLYDEVSDELLTYLEDSDLPVQIQLTGEFIELKSDEPFPSEDGTVHVNRRFNVTAAPVLVKPGDGRWVTIRRGRKMSRQAINEFMPRAKPGREVTDYETVAQLRERVLGASTATALASEGAREGIPAAEAEALEPSFGCTPDLD